MHTPTQEAENAPAEAGVILSADELAAGDRVVYPKQGVCRVLGRQTTEVGGMKFEVVALAREEDNASILVPVPKVPTVGLRKLADSNELADVFDLLGSNFDDPELDWKVRHRMHGDLLAAGGILGVAEVLKALQALANMRPLPQKERERYDAARHLLVDELAVALGVSHATAEDYVDLALIPPPGVERRPSKPRRLATLPPKPKRPAPPRRAGAEEEEGIDELDLEDEDLLGDEELPPDEEEAEAADEEGAEEEAEEEAPAPAKKKPAAKKPAAKKAAAKKPAAKKAPARKAATKKADEAADEGPARKAPAKKAATKTAAAEKPAAKKAPTRKTAAKKTADEADEAPAKKAPAKKAASKSGTTTAAKKKTAASAETRASGTTKAARARKTE